MWPRRQPPNASAEGFISATESPNSSASSLFLPRRSATNGVNDNIKAKESANSSSDDVAWMLRAFDRKKKKAENQTKETGALNPSNAKDAVPTTLQKPRNGRKGGAIGLTMSLQERQQLWRSGAAKKPQDEAAERAMQQGQEQQEIGFDRVFQVVFGKTQAKQQVGDNEKELDDILHVAGSSSLGLSDEKGTCKVDGDSVNETKVIATRKRQAPDHKEPETWSFATGGNNVDTFDVPKESCGQSINDAKAAWKTAKFERWKSEDARTEVSTNFVRLNMRKRYKGSSGRAKKQPAYLRSRKLNPLDDATRDNSSTGLAPLVNANGSQQHSQDKSFLATDGVDFIEECLEALAKAERARDGIDPEPTTLQEQTEPLIPPRCHHALVCQTLEVKKKNKNHGRRFYACSLSLDEGRCDFFLWEDDHVPLALQTLFTVSSPTKDGTAAPAIECVPLNLEASEGEQQEALLTNLRLVFGHAEFRAGQQWAIARVLRRQDTLLVLPTGAGKSLCYQFAALFLPGLTLVISPLIALMHDQYESLPALLKARAVCLSTSSNSSSSKAEHAAFVRNVLAGKVSLVFLSPEKALGAGMQALLAKPCVRAHLALVCVDEAHCISEWSHHFRPSYLRLADVFRHAQCVLCVTATASQRVVRDVLHQLQWRRRQSPTNVCEPEDTMVLQLPWQRSNLALEVRSVDSNEERLRHLVHTLPELSKGACRQGTIGGVIVYVHQQRQTEELAALLCERLPAPWRTAGKVLAYHAGMSPDAKEKVRTGFARGRVRVVVATVAFGMGIDKKNVRAVVHFHMPSSVEAYVQQIGRAGRDGKAARALLYLLGDDAIYFRSLLFSTALHREQLRRLLALVFQAHEPLASVVAVKYLRQQAKEELILVSLEQDWLERYLDLKAATIETFLTLLALETQRDGAAKDDHVRVALEPVSMSRCTVQLLDTQAKKLAPRSCVQRLVQAVRRKELPHARLSHYKNGYLSSWTIDFHVHETAQWYAQVYSSGQKRSVKSFVAAQHGETNSVAVAAAMNARRILQDLRAAQQTGQVQCVTLSQPAFQIQLSGPVERTKDTNTEAVDRWDAVLYAKHEDLASRQLARLAHLYAALHAAALPIPSPTARRVKDDDLNVKARLLETKLARYFETNERSKEDEDEKLLQQLLRPLSASLIECIERDTRSLVHRTKDVEHEEDEPKSDKKIKWTSYAVAKVFHGLATPQFPIRQWRDHVCWRRYSDVAFERLVNISHKVLMEDQV